jgi:hypothetical protein
MNTMKTNSVLRTLFIALTAVVFSNTISAQFTGTSTVIQTPIEERKGGTSTYTIAGPSSDAYSWQVVGGTVVVPAAGVTGSGTAGSPYVVPFTVGLQEIQVAWPADDNTITSVAGNVSAQRRVANATVTCPSSIQDMDVSLWSNATITIDAANYAICSGDATSGDITVRFTGAPNFDFKYTVTGLDGVSTEQTVTGITGASTTISIPGNLLNTSGTVDQTYVVTINEMNDGFNGLGDIINGTFTITVHPTIETGPITGNRTLTRR